MNHRLLKKLVCSPISPVTYKPSIKMDLLKLADRHLFFYFLFGYDSYQTHKRAQQESWSSTAVKCIPAIVLAILVVGLPLGTIILQLPFLQFFRLTEVFMINFIIACTFLANSTSVWQSFNRQENLRRIWREFYLIEQSFKITFQSKLCFSKLSKKFMWKVLVMLALHLTYYILLYAFTPEQVGVLLKLNALSFFSNLITILALSHALFYILLLDNLLTLLKEQI